MRELQLTAGKRRASFVLVSAASIVLITQSGSSQGYVALLVIALTSTLVFASTRERHARSAIHATLAVALGCGVALFLADLPNLPDDIRTLSDRSPLFEAAIYDFARNPIIGSGLDSVSAGDVLERSAHSAILANFASGGIFAGVLWIAILAVALAWALRTIVRGDISGAAFLVILTLQFVQTVQFAYVTWVVIAMSTWWPNRGKDEYE